MASLSTPFADKAGCQGCWQRLDKKSSANKWGKADERKQILSCPQQPMPGIGLPDRIMNGVRWLRVILFCFEKRGLCRGPVMVEIPDVRSRVCSDCSEHSSLESETWKPIMLCFPTSTISSAWFFTPLSFDVVLILPVLLVECEGIVVPFNIALSPRSEL